MALHRLVILLPFLAAAVADVAPAPAPAQLNLTGVLESGGQYATFLRLLNATQIGEQLSIQLKSTYDGLTVFAPTDSAFAKLKAGTLNGLSDQQQVQLALSHVLPRYYSLTTFQTASNPLHTEASGRGGVYSVNVTSTTSTSMVNVSTGVVAAAVGTTLFAEFPLAVYSVDDVLLPEPLFGGKAKTSSAPAPAGAGKTKAKKKGVPKSDVAAEPSGDEDAEDTTNAAAGSRGFLGWGGLVAVAMMGFSI